MKMVGKVIAPGIQTSTTMEASSKLIVRISRCGVDASRIFTNTNRVKAMRVEMQFMGSVKFWQFIRS